MALLTKWLLSDLHPRSCTSSQHLLTILKFHSHPLPVTSLGIIRQNRHPAAQKQQQFEDSKHVSISNSGSTAAYTKASHMKAKCLHPTHPPYNTKTGTSLASSVLVIRRGSNHQHGAPHSWQQHIFTPPILPRGDISVSLDAPHAIRVPFVRPPGPENAVRICM